MTDETTLLPCPFCGGKAYEGYRSIVCHTCDLRMVASDSKEGWEQRLADRWNRRYEPTCTWKAVCDERWWETECGMTYECYDAAEPPNYCQNCGAKVIEE